jgi:enoyl-CoA hydratase/carnithine racemase
MVTLNRPDRLNAQTDTMFEELEWLGSDLHDRSDVRCVVLTGAGRGFCAGFDLDLADGLAELGAIDMLRRQARSARAMHALRLAPMPVIAAVNGPAAGGGMALALAADIRLGTATTCFGAAFVRIGLSAGDLGTSWLLSRLVGHGAAAEMVFTGRLVKAGEAERLGLLNGLFPADALIPEAIAMAEAISGNSPGAVRLSKSSLNANMEISSYASALELENRGQALLARSDDMHEALTALLGGREPQFTDH